MEAYTPAAEKLGYQGVEEMMAAVMAGQMAIQRAVTVIPAWSLP